MGRSCDQIFSAFFWATPQCHHREPLNQVSHLQDGTGDRRLVCDRPFALINWKHSNNKDNNIDTSVSFIKLWQCYWCIVFCVIFPDCKLMNEFASYKVAQMWQPHVKLLVKSWLENITCILLAMRPSSTLRLPRYAPLLAETGWYYGVYFMDSIFLFSSIFFSKHNSKL